MSEHFFLYNNQFYPENTPVISPGNRSLRYGDGLFETMKMVNGRIINKAYHFERLYTGLALLEFEFPGSFNATFLEKKILDLVAKNKHEKTIRVRLMLFRANGGIFEMEDLFPQYIIETMPINEPGIFESGLVIDTFPGVKKSCDVFSNLKSNNYLPSVMAGLFARKNALDDCIVMNTFERVCETAVANIFIIMGENIFTPPLKEGCVAGTMRRWMLEKFSLKKYKMIEKPLSPDDLLQADELFLTNAVSYVRGVQKFGDKNYGSKKIKEIYKHILETI